MLDIQGLYNTAKEIFGASFDALQVKNKSSIDLIMKKGYNLERLETFHHALDFKHEDIVITISGNIRIDLVKPGVIAKRKL